MPVEITLPHGRVAVVDDADAALVQQYRWTQCGSGRYAMTTTPVADGRKAMMHRLILDPPRGMEVDHIDGNGLNNRRENLRIVTPRENAQNKSAQRVSRTGIRGVYYIPDRSKYRAQVRSGGRKYTRGYFSSIEDAAAAAVELRKQHHTHANEARSQTKGPRPVARPRA